jgi:hypothetical protein
MIKLTQQREIAPYKWVHPDDDGRRQRWPCFIHGRAGQSHGAMNAPTPSLIPLQLPFAPMRLFAIGLEFPHQVPMQRLQDTNPRHHGVAATAAQHQHLDRSSPFRKIGFLLRQARDVCRGVFEVTSWRPFGRMIGSSKGVGHGTRTAPQFINFSKVSNIDHRRTFERLHS